MRAAAPLAVADHQPPVVEPVDRLQEEDAEEALEMQSFRAGVVSKDRKLSDVDVLFLETFEAKAAAGKLELVLPPAAAMDVMRLVDDPHCSMNDISDAISRDPALAGSVVKQANSVVYRGTEDVLHLHDAVVRLGQRSLRMLLLSVVLGSTRVRGQPFAVISDLTWRHSLITARLARRIARLCNLDAELAYMAGLFHNVGVLAILSAARGHASETRLRPTSRGIVEIVHRHGYRTNARVVETWGLPAEVAHAVTSFRTWIGDPDRPKLACVTELANDISKNAGVWVEHHPFGAHLQRQLSHLGLTMADVPSRNELVSLAREVEQTASFL